jgi:hypothetical protein
MRQDRAAGRVRQRPERRVEGRGIVNHMVNYMTTAMAVKRAEPVTYRSSRGPEAEGSRASTGGRVSSSGSLAALGMTDETLG